MFENGEMLPMLSLFTPSCIQAVIRMDIFTDEMDIVLLLSKVLMMRERTKWNFENDTVFMFRTKKILMQNSPALHCVCKSLAFRVESHRQ